METSLSKYQKDEFWESHIKKWADSSLSQGAYCEAEGIKLVTFCYYRQRFLKSKGQPKAPISFVTATQKSASGSQALASLQLMLPNGIRIGVSNEVSESPLTMVLNVAGQAAC